VAGPGGSAVRVKVFTTSGANFREAWVACPSGYTAISGSVNRNSTGVSFRWEPGTMSGADAQSGTVNGAPPGGTTFARSNDGDSSPNGYHFSTSANINNTRLILVCIPN
jgi:hypothetical protein